MSLAVTHKQLLEIAEVIRGVTFKKSDANNETSDDLIPILRAGNIQDTLNLKSDLVWLPKKKISSSQYLHRNDIVMCTSSGSPRVLGKSAMLEKDWKGSFGAFCVTIRAKHNVCHPNYLYHFLRSSKFRNWTTNSSGVNIKNIRKSELEQFPIPLPPLPEQKRIAAILDKADAIRRKRQQAIKLADDFLRATFLDMFGDPVTNPKGWEVRPIGEMLTFLTSGSRGWAKYYSSDGALFLRIQNIGANELILNDVAFVNPPENAEARRTRVQAGDVLMSITADLGRTAVIPDSFPVAHINQHLAILRFEGVDSLYASAFLASSGGQVQINKLNREGVKAGLNFDNIRSLKMMIPPEPLQKKWRSIYVKKAQHFKTLNDAGVWDTQLFNSLTQRAFRGEL